MNGDRTTGVTVIRLNERMDEGDIILKEEAPIGCDDTNVTITERLSKLGASALMKAVDMMALKGSATPLEKQDGRFATYAPKLKKKDGLIDWKESAVKIHNKVRGLLPWPGAYTHYGAMTIKVLKSEMVDVSADGAVPGEVVRASPAEGIVVKAGSGAVSIRYLKPEGKREMDSGSFLLGHELKKGYRFK
jgi:methionyl-tRNA formyltransferase